jgi:protein TonB
MLSLKITIDKNALMTVMTNPAFQQHSIYDEQTLSFSFKKKSVQKVLGSVLAIHLIIFLISFLGFPDFKFNKRPDITIEIGAAPPASSGPVSQTKPTPALVQKEAPKEKTPPPSKDKDAPAIPVPAQAPQSSAQPVAPSSGGAASAPTADADYKAAYLQNPKPPYPPLAFRLKLEGKVTLLAEVGSDGRAGQVKILESSGHELLDQSALSTVKQWKFTPARKDGVIITQAVRIPITFSLKNR